MTEVLFAKYKEKAIIPSKIAENAGFDIYACIDKSICIEPHQTVMIPTGIASACSSDYCFILKERGSTGTKGIGQRCGVIDSGYRGEWFVPITNHTEHYLVLYNPDEVNEETIQFAKDCEIIIYPTSKAITQALVVPVPRVSTREVSLDELNSIGSERGTGALGSSGK